MKINKSNKVIFFASMFLGIIIVMNINFWGKNRMLLSPEDYSEAYNKRNNLYNEISHMKEEYYNAYKKLDIYKANDENKYSVIQEIQKELDKNNLLFGIEPVEGEGVKIIVNDATTGSFGEYYDIYSVIHDYDIVELVNDLKNAGAEAISINGQRIIYSSYSYCGGSYINLGGTKIVPPFYINAIGDKRVLKNYLLLNNTHFKELALRRIRTEIYEVDHIRIPGYTGNTKFQYMHETK